MDYKFEKGGNIEQNLSSPLSIFFPQMLKSTANGFTSMERALNIIFLKNKSDFTICIIYYNFQCEKIRINTEHIELFIL